MRMHGLWLGPLAVCACLLSGLACQSQGGTTASTTSTSTSSTTTTYTSRTLGCPAVQLCHATPNCSKCLTAIATAVDVRSVRLFKNLNLNGLRKAELAFGDTLVRDANCRSQIDSAGLFWQVVNELIDSQQASGRCVPEGGLALTACDRNTFACLANVNCRPCLEAVVLNGTKSFDVFDSMPSCRTAYVKETFALLDGACSVFPCVRAKQLCESDTLCRGCLIAMGKGGVVTAARDCPGTSLSGVILGVVVGNCAANTPLSHEFWTLRCRADSACHACLSELGDFSNHTQMALAGHSSSCTASRGNTNIGFLQHVIQTTPNITSCQVSVALCVVRYEACGECITSPDNYSSTCRQLVGVDGTGITAACRTCPKEVQLIQRIVLATSAIGGVSVLACLFTIARLLRGDGRQHLRTRILLGLLAANAIYSCANTMPMNYIHNVEGRCGTLALSDGLIRTGRALWFCGK